MKKILFVLLVSLTIMPVVLSGCSNHIFKTKSDIAINEVRTIANNSYTKYYLKNNKSFSSFYDQTAINDGIYPKNIVKNNTAYNPWNGVFSISSLSLFGVNYEYILNMTNMPAKDCLKIGLSTYKLKRFISFDFLNNPLVADTPAKIKQLCSTVKTGNVSVLWEIGVTPFQRK